jgi:type VI secretion system Hcp family effector
MASEYFLKITTKKGGDIKGETLSNHCKDEIEISKFTIGITSPGSHSDTGQAVASGRVQLEEAEFEFDACAASVAMFQTICTNDPIKSAVLSCLKAGPSGKTGIFLQWKFNDARIVSYTMEGVDDGVPEDKIRIAYSGVEISYKKQKADGTISPNGSSAAYDAGENAMTTATLQ